MAHLVTAILAAAIAAAGFLAVPAQADPVTTAVVTAAAISAGSSVASSLLAGTAIVWATVAAGAVVSGTIAGVSASMRAGVNNTRRQNGGSITSTSVQPVTEGLILYGERILGGTIVARTGSEKNSVGYARYHSMVAFCCHEITSYEKIWLGDALVWTRDQYEVDEASGAKSKKYWGQVESSYRGKFGLILRWGTPGQYYVGAITDADVGWTSNARGRGIAYVYFEFDFGEVFSSGAPTMRAQIRGKPVYDPRSDTIGFSENPALHLLDYVTTPEAFGGIGWDQDDVDMSGLLALANVCDEAVATADGGTQARYAFNGVLETAASPTDNLDALATSWGGWWAHDRGLLTVGGGAYQVPEFSITPDMMRGPIQRRARLAFEAQANVVKGVFADASAEYVLTDLPVLRSGTYISEDGGHELTRDLGEIPGETDRFRGQRLQKISMLKGRRQKSAEVPCDLRAWGLRLGDTAILDVPWAGWAEKPFEVLGWAAEVGPAETVVHLSLIETSPEVYDWSTSEETPGVGGVPSTLPNPADPPVVSTPTVVEELYEARGGGGIRLRVNLTATSDNPYIRGWQFGWYRATEDADEATISATSTSAEAQLIDFEPGQWIFGARAISTRDVIGPWSWGAVSSVEGLGAAPEAVADLSIQASGGLAVLKWSRHTSLDVRQGGRIEFRHAQAQVGAIWEASTSIGQSVGGGETQTTLPLKAGTYLCRAYDAQGLIGPVSQVSTRAPSLAGWSTVASVIEAPGFGGVATDCAVDAGVLSIDPGVLLAGYDFAGVIDLGSVQNVRLTSILTVAASSRSSLFWDRSGAPFWRRGGAPFWTASGATGDLVVMVAETDDDPTGAPVWSDWARLDAADLQARAFKFRAVLTVESESHVLAVSEMTVTAEQ